MQAKTREKNATHSDDLAADPVPGRVRRTIFAGAVFALILAVGATIALGVRADSRTDRLRQDESSRAAAIQRAEQGMRLLIGIDGATGKDNLDKLSKWATGEFADQLETLSETVVGVLAQGEVASQGDVAAVGLEGLRGGQAKVLLAATALVSNSELPDGELRTYRVVTTLNRVDDEWKIVEVEFLG